jgi:hypothetical protein
MCYYGITPSDALASGPPYTEVRGSKAGPQLSLSRGPWAPHGHCLGAPNEKAQGALGPPIKIISGNPVTPNFPFFGTDSIKRTSNTIQQTCLAQFINNYEASRPLSKDL